MSEPDFEECWAEEHQRLQPKPAKPNGNGGPKIRSVADIRSIFSFAGQKIDYIVEGFLAAGTVNALTGDSGCGKSTLASAMGSAIERGEPFAGMATSRRPVLILDRENRLSIVVDRFERLGIRDSENYRVWGAWEQEEPPDANSQLVAGWVVSTDPKPVIFVDSLVAFRSGDENDAAATRAHMDGYRKLANFGATIVILHHNGKGESSKDYRGSSDFKASLDVGYLVTNIGNPARIESLRLKAFKQRFAVNAEFVLRFRDGEFQADQHCDEQQTNLAIMVRLLMENPRVTIKEFEKLATAKGVGNHRARSFLKSGVSEGSIDLETGQNNAKYYTWLGVKNGA